MVAVFATIILFCGAVAVIDWRRGLLLLVVVAVFQDPLRKLLPEEPVYINGLVALVLAAVVVGAFLKGTHFGLRRITWWGPGLSMPFLCFMVWLFVHSVYSYSQFGNLMLVAVGLIFYLGPIAAFLIGHQFALRMGERGIEQWLTFYLIVITLALSTVLMEHLGMNLEVFGQVGPGMLIYDFNVVLKGSSGIFRATEVAAWHSATSACVVLLLYSTKVSSYRKIVIALLIAFLLIGFGIVTGRRKLLMEFLIFLIAYSSILLTFRLGARKIVINTLLAGVLLVGSIWILADEPEARIGGSTTDYELYVQRGLTVFGDATERAQTIGVNSVFWAAKRFGFWGGGIGVATQGAQYFGGGGKVFGSAGEGGLGKIMAELGAPGMAIVAWGVISLLRHVIRILTFASSRSIPTARLASGIFALLIANAAVYFVATQVFGDIFILIFLGLNVGFLLAIPVLAARSQAVGQTIRSWPLRPHSYTSLLNH